MTTNNKIDLRTCVPGQEVELRDGTIVKYDSKFKCSTDYPHLVGGESYTHDGHYLVSRTEDSWDIVKIFPLNKPTTDIDLNTCVPGQKVKLRDESIGTYNGLIDENTIYKHAVDGYSYTNNGRFWEEDGRISTKDVIEILPGEEEPVKTASELTHSITDQIDVSNPDHVSIIPNENGVTISIKKGNTTINWKRSNR